jgi:hypothetical protein
MDPAPVPGPGRLSLAILDDDDFLTIVEADLIGEVVPDDRSAELRTPALVARWRAALLEARAEGEAELADRAAARDAGSDPTPRAQYEQWRTALRRHLVAVEAALGESRRLLGDGAARPNRARPRTSTPQPKAQAQRAARPSAPAGARPALARAG